MSQTGNLQEWNRLVEDWLIDQQVVTRTPVRERNAGLTMLT